MRFPGRVVIRNNHALKRQKPTNMVLAEVSNPGEEGFSDLRYTREAEHGAKQAQFKLYGQDVILRTIGVSGLMREVSILTPDGRSLWGGVIWSMVYDNGRKTFQISMEDVWNEFWTRYQETGTGVDSRGTVVTDQDSIDQFGKKQGVLRGGELMDLTVADQYASQKLAWHAWPGFAPLEFRIGGKQERMRPQSLQIKCVGWKDLLNMQVYNRTGGSSEYVSQLLTDIVGMPGIKKNLVAWWDLEETGVTDTRIDAFGENHLQPVNSPTQGAGPGSLSAVYLASASSQYLKIPSNPLIAFGEFPFSVASWVYLTSHVGSDVEIIAKDSDGGGNREFILWHSNALDRFRATVAKPTDSLLSVTANSLGAPANATWYFLVVWYNPATNTIYIQANNGAIDSQAVGGKLQAPGTAFLGFGARQYPGFPSYLNGRLAMPLVARRIWTATEHGWLYNSGNGRTFAEVSRCPFLRDAIIANNPTPVSENTDLDMRMGDIVDSNARLGDPSGQRWAAWVTDDAVLKYERMPPPTLPVS